jgi:hypothetical protein
MSWFRNRANFTEPRGGSSRVCFAELKRVWLCSVGPFLSICHTVSRFSKLAGARMSMGYALGGRIGRRRSMLRSGRKQRPPWAAGHFLGVALPFAWATRARGTRMAIPVVSFCGREFSGAELQLIAALVQRCAGLSRMELAATVCELLQWQRPGGGLKARECREFLERLDGQGVLQLPPKRQTKPVGSRTRVPVSARGEAGAALEGQVGAFAPVVLERVQTAPQRLLFRELVGRHHYLGHAVPFGAHLRYLFSSGAQVLGAMQFSSPAWRLAVRERWIGWDEAARRANLQRVVNQSRFLILPWVQHCQPGQRRAVARAAAATPGLASLLWGGAAAGGDLCR